MIRGITVTLITKHENGIDPFGNPVFDDVEELVENVLVAPASSDDLISTIELDGKKLIYIMAIPKSDLHDWIDCEVEFLGKRWKTFGFPQIGIDDNIPGPWNRKVMVELYG